MSNEMSSKLEAVLTGLKSVKRSGAGWSASCPAHADKTPSLSVRLGEDDRVLVKCHAGCTFDAIASALGLSASAFMSDTPARGRAVARTNRSSRKVHPTLQDAKDAIVRGSGGSGLSRVVGEWVYPNAHGNEVFRVVRFEHREKGKSFRPMHPRDNGWVIGDPKGLLPLYGLPTLDVRQPVFVVEGEKCADVARTLGLMATTSAHGAESATKSDWSPLAGAEVVVLPDNDDAGRKYADDVARLLLGLSPPAVVRIAELPGLEAKGDIANFVDARLAKGVALEEIGAQIRSLANESEPRAATALPPDPDDAASEVQDSDRRSVSTRLVALVKESGAELFHNAAGATFVTMLQNGRPTTSRIKDQTFKEWLFHSFYVAERRAANASAVADACTSLSGCARFEGTEREAYIRVAGCDGSIYIDLGDVERRVVQIDASGWRIVDEPRVRFLRPPLLRALPVPQRGGTLDELRKFVNVDDNTFPLAVAWTLAGLRPQGPYPVLVLTGPHGSAKTTTGRVLQRLIDPSKAEMRSAPQSVRDLAIAASHSRTLTFDNLSNVAEWFSDALCRLSTGGVLTTRALFTDGDEAHFDNQAPVLLTSIEDVVTKPDLLDRALVCTSREIPPSQRKEELVFWQEFDEAAPRILGALFDAVANGIRRLSAVQLSERPRMADFATWIVACDDSLPGFSGGFMKYYARNRDHAAMLALESSPLAQALIELLARNPSGVREPATTLLARLKAIAFQNENAPSGWPRSASSFTGQLKRLEADLRGANIEVTFVRSLDRGRTRLTCVRRVGPEMRTTADDPTINADDAKLTLAVSSDDADDADDADDVSSIPMQGESWPDFQCRECHGTAFEGLPGRGGWGCTSCGTAAASSKSSSNVVQGSSETSGSEPAADASVEPAEVSGNSSSASSEASASSGGQTRGGAA